MPRQDPPQLRHTTLELLHHSPTERSRAYPCPFVCRGPGPDLQLRGDGNNDPGYDLEWRKGPWGKRTYSFLDPLPTLFHDGA